MDTIFEKKEFLQEWRDLIEETGGDIGCTKPKQDDKPGNGNSNSDGNISTRKHLDKWTKWTERLGKVPQPTLNINYSSYPLIPAPVRSRPSSDFDGDEIQLRRSPNDVMITSNTGNINYSSSIPNGIIIPQRIARNDVMTTHHLTYPFPGKKKYINSPSRASLLEEQDIQLVMAQVHCTYDRAQSALRRYDGDIVDSILYLQTGGEEEERPFMEDVD